MEYSRYNQEKLNKKISLRFKKCNVEIFKSVVKLCKKLTEITIFYREVSISLLCSYLLILTNSRLLVTAVEL